MAVLVVGACLLHGGATSQAASPLQATGEFENGNGRVVAIDQEARSVTIAPVQIRGARNIWWHVEISGIEPGETIELHIQDFNRVAGEAHPVYSYDGETWHRMDSETTPHRQTFEQSKVRIARNLPYTHTDSLMLAERLAESPRVNVSDLCTSEEGRPVKLLRFTDPKVPDADKQLVWVQARQHAFESHSSHVAEGLAEWLIGDSPEAVKLLGSTIVYVVPVMDVDSVATGAAGKDQKPVDFNRCWGKDAHWVAVRSVIARLDEETQHRPLLAFIDLHSPWYRNTNHWYLPDPEPMKHNARAFAERFEQALDRFDAANSWKNRYTDLRASEPVRSRNYAVDHWLAADGPGVAITKETAHWKDNDGRFITVQGLRDYGAALGMALNDTVPAAQAD